MTKEETYDTHVYVESQSRALPVGMHTDEHSEVCSIRFGSSFTLNVVTPQDLLMLAREIETFAKRAHELHYGEEPTGFRRPVGEAMAEIQKKLESCGVVEPVGVEWAINEARTMAEETKSQKEIMMKGMSSSCVWKDPSDPVNW